VARSLKFLDSLGQELHHIDDPEERLPIPASGQVIVIGSSTMWVESVTTLRDAGTPILYFVIVRAIPAGNSLGNIC
jgi:hypothetical protein